MLRICFFYSGRTMSWRAEPCKGKRGVSVPAETVSSVVSIDTSFLQEASANASGSAIVTLRIFVFMVGLFTCQTLCLTYQPLFDCSAE
jgi:hypothetical protein